jgi:uncharacterized Zn finger protein (UPF0148 family)
MADAHEICPECGRLRRKGETSCRYCGREHVSVVQVRRNGRVLETFYGERADNEAYEWLLKHQPQSWDYAKRYGGYSVVRVFADGSETNA